MYGTLAVLFALFVGALAGFFYGKIYYGKHPDKL